MRIAVVGTGYVGLVAGTCFADSGHTVTCVDVDAAKVEQLRAGQTPIYEPGLEELLQKNLKAGRLSFTTGLVEAVRQCEVVFIAVGTPQGEDGNADLRVAMSVAHQIADAAERYTVIVNKSTVPVGTASRMQAEIAARSKVEIDVVSNPEFLKEGAAIDDFQRPDRIVIGAGSDRARALIAELYAPYVRTESPMYFMDPRSAELTKYAANAMLATRISFMNEVAMLCERVGADVDSVRKAMGSDKRIGQSFLFPGAGYGGSCFPKDVKALVATARNHGLDFALLADGMRITVHDPVAMETSRRQLGDRVEYTEHPYAALEGADALFLMTEWNEFRQPDFQRILAAMKQPILFDGRNIWNAQRVRQLGFTYYGVGRGL